MHLRWNLSKKEKKNHPFEKMKHKGRAKEAQINWMQWILVWYLSNTYLLQVKTGVRNHLFYSEMHQISNASAFHFLQTRPTPFSTDHW